MAKKPLSEKELDSYFDAFLKHANQRLPIASGSDPYRFNSFLSDRSRKMLFPLNSSYMSLHEIQKTIALLTRSETDRSLKLQPPFFCECGINLHLGRRIFINSGCTFQDQGGIFIGDDCQIGHNVTILTINHGLKEDDRSTLYPSPVKIAENVWIGSGSIILPGISIGKNAVIGAGSVVTKDIQENETVAGNPAKPLRQAMEPL